MVLITALVRALHARFQCPVDILTSGPWSEPLLKGQPGVGEIFSVRSRKTPYWMAPDQRRVVRRLRLRGPGPTWFCDANDAARPMLMRAGFADELIVNVKDHPLLPGEHATEQWLRLAQIMPRRLRSQHGAPRRAAPNQAAPAYQEPPAGCYLEVSERQQSDLDAWLKSRGLKGPIITIQIGNKRTMRRGLRRLAVNNKYWPTERWAAVIRHVRAQYPLHQIVLLGTKPEFRMNADVAARTGVGGLCNAADDLPIPRLVALLSRAAALISVDSGPAHAAAAVGCPQVVLFGRALPSLYRPLGVAGAEVRVLCGRYDGETSMLGISTQDVIEAWNALKLRGEAVEHPLAP
jgi:heptosyltransferase-2/heptosyltransferase-3